MAEIDTNGDGEIEFSEFEMMMRMFLNDDQEDSVNKEELQ